MDCQSYCLRIMGQMIWLQKSRCSLTLKNFTGENPIAVRVFLANLKDTFDKCGVCKSEAAPVLAYFLIDGDKKVYKTYPANGMCADAYVYHGTLPVLMNALIQRFLT